MGTREAPSTWEGAQMRKLGRRVREICGVTLFLRTQLSVGSALRLRKMVSACLCTRRETNRSPRFRKRGLV